MFGRSAILALLGATCAVAQSRFPIGSIRPLVVNKTEYRLRAGHSVKIEAPPETLDFLRNAKSRVVAIGGSQGRGFVVGPNVRGDEVLLAASLTLKPGQYAVTVLVVSVEGDERAVVMNVTLEPMQPVPSTSTVPPVVLLNGWQFGYSSTSGLSTCPISSGSADTFGSLENQLTTSQSVPVFNVPNGGVIDGVSVPE